MTRIDVPTQFHEAGFGGDFWLDVVTETPLLWRRLVPCLLGNSGWMALRVNADDSVTVVRKDAAAIFEAFTRAPGSVRPPTLALPIAADDWITSPPRYRAAHQLDRDSAGRPVSVTLCGRVVRGRIVRALSTLSHCPTCARRSRRNP
jgi:hypothetical protein